MTYQDPVPGSPHGGGSAGSTTEVAKEQAGRVGQKATEAGGQVAQTTKEQAQNVVGEARTQVRDQAGAQRDRAVLGLRTLGDELEQMAQQGGQSGIATELARQLSSRTRDLAGELERREPSDLLEQLRSYARRRPAVFLAGAALAGVVAGRLTKSLSAGAPDDGSRALTTGYDGYGTARPLAVESPPYAAPDYPSTGYQTPAYGTAGYPAADDYGTTGGGFRETDVGAPGSAYGAGQEPGYTPPAPPYEPEQPPARGWNP